MKCRRLFLRLAVLAVTSTTLRATAQTGRGGNAPISVTSLPDSLIIIGTNEWLPIIYTFTNHTDVSIRIRDRLAYFLSFDRDVKTANGPLATSLTVPSHSIAMFPDRAYFPSTLIQAFQKADALKSGSFLFVQTFTAALDSTRTYSVAVPVPVNVVSFPPTVGRVSKIAIPNEESLNKGAGQGDALYLTLRLNERDELLFVVDTGSAFTVFDQSVVTKLGKPIGATLLEDAFDGKQKPIACFKAPSLYLGKALLRTADWVTAWDLNLFRQVLGRPVMGILGMDCLIHYCIQLDFDAGKLRFLDPDHPGDEAWGKVFPLTLLEDGRCAVSENLMDVEGFRTLIDTGFVGTGSLQSNLFAQAINDAKTHSGFARYASFGGAREGREGRFARCIFGGQTYRNLILGEAQTTFLGLDFLARHRVTLNFPKLEMYLKRRTTDLPDDESGMSGLSITRNGEDAVVNWVGRDSAAERAGVKAGDVVLKLNGRPAKELELWEIRNMLAAGDGKEVRLTVQRASKTKRFIIVLKRKL